MIGTLRNLRLIFLAVLALAVWPIIPTQAQAPGGSPGAATTTACMATVIADFTPQSAGAVGYQQPGACAPDAYFPTWLNGIIPNGIITKPCGA